MNHKSIAQAAVFGVILTALVGASSIPAHAQQDKSQTLIPSMSYSDTAIKDVVRTMFRTVGLNYSIDPAVHGKVNVDLKNVTFETALENVLRQVGATYRVEAGVYEIVPDQGVSATEVATSDSSDSAITQDSKFLFVVRGTTVYEIRKSDLHVVAKCDL